MRTTRPRQLSHVGHVSAVGVIIDAQLLGETEARRRVLAHWSPGTTVSGLDGGWVVRFPAPRLLSAHSAPGTVLVADAGVPSAAPLTAKERAALKPDPAGVVVVRGGTAQVSFPTRESINPSDWLDATAFRVVAVAPLAGPPPKLIEAEVVAPIDARAKLLPGVPLPPPEQAAVIRALMTQQSGPGQGAKVQSELSETVMRGAYVVGTGFVMLFAPLLRLFGRATASEQGTGGGGVAAQPSALSRLLDRMQGWLSRSLMQSRLSKLFASRQAQYLSRMIDMFEQGQLDEALRHAIPLGRGNSQPRTPELGLPSRRDQLKLSNGQAASTSFMWPHDVHELLRQKYRAAFEQLSRAGRIDEAAFVLIELLASYEEAVAFLEKHGRLQLAAEIAESRKLEPGFVIRQWFLAGNKQRAMDIARRTGAFMDALVRLEKSDKGAALSFRLEWADHLASSGRLIAAVETILPVTRDASCGATVVAGARRLLLAWVDRGIELGGPTGAALLARKSALEPEKFEEIKARVLDQLKSTDEATTLALAAGFSAVLSDTRHTGPEKQTAKVLSRALARTLIAMSPRHASAFGLASGLIDLAGGGMLRADLPQVPVSKREALTSLERPRAYEVADHDTGRSTILDAVLLPNGRILLALGDAGARLVTRDGRTVAHFDRPTHSLVMSDEGDRAIAIGDRGPLKILSRIDLHARTIRPWLEVEINHWAKTYDGATWFVGTRDRLHAIDALSNQWREIWSSAPERSVGVERLPDGGLAWLVRSERALEIWLFSTPDLLLRERPEVRFPEAEGPNAVEVVAFHFSGGRGIFVLPVAVAQAVPFFIPMVRPATGPIITMSPEMEALTGRPITPKRRSLNVRALCIAEAGESCPSIVSSNGWVAALLRGTDGTRVELRSHEGEHLRLTLRLGHPPAVSLRFVGNSLVVGDAQGRVFVVDLATGDLLLDLRV